MPTVISLGHEKSVLQKLAVSCFILFKEFKQVLTLFINQIVDKLADLHVGDTKITTKTLTFSICFGYSANMNHTNYHNILNLFLFIYYFFCTGYFPPHQTFPEKLMEKSNGRLWRLLIMVRSRHALSSFRWKHLFKCNNETRPDARLEMEATVHCCRGERATVRRRDTVTKRRMVSALLPGPCQI